MLLQEYILITLSLLLITGSPLYMIYRNKMVESAQKKTSGYSKMRVVRLTSANILFVTVSYLLLLFLYLGTIRFIVPTSIETLILSVLYLLSIGFSLYGAGIYITSIVLEAYTLPQVKTSSLYKTQFIATHLFHGPISHFLIYSGIIFALFNLSVLELMLSHQLPTFPNLALIVLAIPVGILFAISQIYNKTYPYQLVSSLFCLLGFLIINMFYTMHIANGVVGWYFLPFSLSLSTTLLGYFLFIEIKRRRKRT